MRYILFSVLSFFYLPANYGQEIVFSAVASPSVVNVGEQFRVVYELNLNPSGIELPAFDDFQLLGGPMTGSSTSIQVINGKTTQTSQYTYTYYLKATMPGKFTIPPARAKLKGKQYSSNPLTIEVVQGRSAPSSQGQAAKADQPADDDQIFVRLHVDKRSTVVGEQVVTWVKLYTKLPVSGIARGYTGPEFPGFYKEVVELPQNRGLERENVNGEIYNTYVLQRFVIYPQKADELVIAPFDLTVNVQQQVRRQSHGFFDDFFGPTVTEVPVAIKSQPVRITVKPLPSRPSDFSGAVGNFTIKSTVDKKEVHTNDAITFKLTISGKGNIKLLGTPAINFPSHIEVFDPKISVNQATELSGSKTFEYILIPRTAGEFSIPATPFVFFNPEQGNYISLQTDRYDITVYKSEDDTTMLYVSGLSKQDIKVISSDIRFNKMRPNDFRGQRILMATRPLFYVYFLLLALLFTLFTIFWQIWRHQQNDQVRVKNRKAGKVVRNRLKRAGNLMKAGDDKGFYEELTKALWGYVADKLNIPRSELSHQKATEMLLKLSIPSVLANDLLGLIDECEFMRFAPSTDKSAVGDNYSRAIRVISRFEQAI